MSPFARTLAVFLLLCSCSNRDLPTNLNSETDADEDNAVEPYGEYADCSSAADCAPNLQCFHPAGERGYCTRFCDYAEQCHHSGPRHDDKACIGVSGTEFSVCAIPCDGGSCPFNMRCEAVETADGGARLCF